MHKVLHCGITGTVWGKPLQLCFVLCFSNTPFATSTSVSLVHLYQYICLGTLVHYGQHLYQKQMHQTWKGRGLAQGKV